MRAPADLSSGSHLTDAEVAAIAYAGLWAGIAGAGDERRSHLGTCDACQARVDKARRLDEDASRLLRALDLAVPEFDVAEVIGRARRRSGGARKIARYAALAASFLVCALGVVAFALPTSSLGRALQRVIDLGRAAPRRTESARVVSGPAPRTTGGIALSPTGPLTIEFRGGMPSLLRVRYCDTTLAALHVMPRQATTGPGARPDHDRVRFTVSANRIRVATPDDQDDFVLTLPEHTQGAYVTDDDSHPAIAIGPPPPGGHVPHGCHAPVTVPLPH